MTLSDLNPLAAIGGKLIDRFLPDPIAAEKAKAELFQMQQNGELAKMANETEMFKAEQENTTDRWTADMSSDSWLSKNIRPIALIAIFIAYFMFTAMSAFGYNAQESYVNLLGSWGQIVFLAYFGGRTAEKIVEMRSNK